MNLLQREKSFHVLSSSLVMKSVLVLVFEYLKLAKKMFIVVARLYLLLMENNINFFCNEREKSITCIKCL